MLRLAGESAMPYAAAAGAAVGAWMLFPTPLVATLLVLAVFVWRPNPMLAFLAFWALSGLFGVKALDGMVVPEAGAVEAWVTLLDDPRSLGSSGIRVTVRHEGKRYEAQAHGPVAGRFRNALAGERLHITGKIRPSTSDWHRWRHVVGKITVESVTGTAPAAPLAGFTNGVRRLLAHGAESLSVDDRSLFSGMVYGDDREQSDRLADDFRAAGLGHLLVVSGQNVAFVLALVSPLASRLRPGGRLLALLGVLGVFAMLTRFEPSVLRAVAMAAVAVTSAALGRPEVGRRTLAWAIAVVLVVDPFVIRMLAFQLSVCATAGLLWITPPLTEALPGPRPLRLAVATTAGAQIAVMPLLVAVFGSIPLASLPANVLAGPASGPVMMWGLTAGLGAGLVGGWLAWLVHQPTALLLWWVRSCAAVAATTPPAVLGAASSVVVITGVALIIGAQRLSGWIRDDEEGDEGDGAGLVLGVSGGSKSSWIRGDEADGEAGLVLGVSGGSKSSWIRGDEEGEEADIEASLPVVGINRRTRHLGVGSRPPGIVAFARGLGIATVMAVLCYSLITAAVPPSGWSTVAGVSVLRHDAGVVVVLDEPGPPRRLLESLRLAGVRRVDLFIAADGDRADALAVLALTDRYDTAIVLAPPMHRVPGARTVRVGAQIDLGALQGVVISDTPRLEVEFTSGHVDSVAAGVRLSD